MIAAVGRTLRRLALPLASTLAVGGVLVAGVFPARTYLDKRHEVSTAEAELSRLTDANDRAQQQVDALHRDAEIERIAREDYGLVKQGEEPYRILPTPQEPVQIPDVWPFDQLHTQLGEPG